MTFWGRLVQALPGLRTAIQLTGLIVIVAAFLVTQLVPVVNTSAMIAGGTIGVLFLVFGQLFQSLRHIPEANRVSYVSRLFLIFALLVVTLALIAAALQLAHANEALTPLEVTDMSLEEINRGLMRVPVLDVKLRNPGTKVVFITRAVLRVRKVWQLLPFAEFENEVSPSKNYDINLRSEGAPYEIPKSISHELQPNAVERFTFTLDCQELDEAKKMIDVRDRTFTNVLGGRAPANLVFLIDVALQYNKLKMAECGSIAVLIENPSNMPYASAKSRANARGFRRVARRVHGQLTEVFEERSLHNEPLDQLKTMLDAVIADLGPQSDWERNGTESDEREEVRIEGRTFKRETKRVIIAGLRKAEHGYESDESPVTFSFPVEQASAEFADQFWEAIRKSGMRTIQFDTPVVDLDPTDKTRVTLKKVTLSEKVDPVAVLVTATDAPPRKSR